MQEILEVAMGTITPRLVLLCSLTVVILFGDTHGEYCSVQVFGQGKESVCVGDSLLKGFTRAPFRGNKASDVISNLIGGKCCTSNGYDDQWPTFRQIVYKSWVTSFDSTGILYSKCDPGYFLSGLIITTNANNLDAINWAVCVKYAGLVEKDEECETIHVDATKNFGCKDDYRIRGIFRSRCGGLACIESLKCCKLNSVPIEVMSMEDAKKKVMEITLKPLASLAKSLGYTGTRGCSGERPGDFFFNATNDGEQLKWQTQISEYCFDKTLTQDKLTIEYNDWRFILDDTAWSEPEEEEMASRDIQLSQSDDKSSLIIRNKGNAESMRDTIVKAINVTKTTSHIQTDSVKMSHAASASLTLKYAFASGTVNYKFNRDDTDIKESAESRGDSNQFQITHTIIVPADTNVEAYLKMPQRSIVKAYTGKVRVHFSVTFKGNLKPRNAHEDAWWTNKNSFHYKFGSQNISFSEDLKDKINNMSKPWLWDDAYASINNLQDTVDQLTSLGHLQFFITGEVRVSEGYSLILEAKELEEKNQKKKRYIQEEHADEQPAPYSESVVVRYKPGENTIKPIHPQPPKMELDP